MFFVSKIDCSIPAGSAGAVAYAGAEVMLAAAAAKAELAAVAAGVAATLVPERVPASVSAAAAVDWSAVIE